MRPLIYKGFSVFEKSFQNCVYEAYLKNTMIHTSHLKISAKNTLKLKIIFHGSPKSLLFALLPLIYSPFILYSLLYSHIFQDIKETL